MAESESAALHRRRFLKGMAVAGGATIAAPAGVQAQAPEKPNGNASPPTAAAKASEREHPPEVERLTTEKTGSDFMVDVCKTLNLDYMAACPGSTFRALQESFINYGQNKRPEWLTCLHEEVSVGMAHGYAKVAGKPMAAIVHGTVGTQHAAMAIYNAYCDRVPMLVFTGNAGCARRTPARRRMVPQRAGRRGHRARLRQVGRLSDVAAAFRRIRRCVAMRWPVRSRRGRYSSPRTPSCRKIRLTSAKRAGSRIPRLATPSQAAGDPNALREAAKMLVAAETPVIIADRYARSQRGDGRPRAGSPSSCRRP